MMRRTLLSLPTLALAGLTLGSCGEDAPVRTPDRPGEGRIAYGDDPDQFGELYLPEGTPRGVVVVVHGGFWLDQYDLTLGAPLATSLAAQGWVAWNLEYRRVGSGGGDPTTFDDVAAGIDMLAQLDLDLTRVVTLGHSAGGHLATWAASRGRFEQWAGGVAVTHVISQAGVLDLVAAHDDGLSDGAVENFLGHAPGPDDAPLDPTQQVPLDVPVWCVHGDGDQNVPPRQSASYVAAATQAGASAELVDVQGDHFVVIDATSAAWTRQLQILDTIG
ncbi:MAG: prolyl oligopeptidase family serine peptidase [Nocardioides sp.]|nr:prolyl oligopeptidase family serine peptidase [Nocardioides sp.]